MRFDQILLDVRLEHLALAVVAWAVLGVLFARQLSERRKRNQVAERLNALIEKPQPAAAGPETLLKGGENFDLPGPTLKLGWLWRRIDLLLAQSGFQGKRKEFIAIECLVLIVPLVGIYAAGPSIAEEHAKQVQVSALIVALLLLLAPPIVLIVKRGLIKRKFTEQLPNAIDLMVAVLKSGHSLPMAVKSVGSEIPAPCGKEFQEVLARMNLGQPMSEALVYSTEKYSSYELDLIRRAVAIQAEVGGSLAELLEKTNGTLRQRLKLARHIKTLTAQSRLTAIIVGLMPFAVAAGLNFLSPGYLNPLFQSSMGNLLLVVALVLQVIGIFIMTKLSTVKV